MAAVAAMPCQLKRAARAFRPWTCAWSATAAQYVKAKDHCKQQGAKLRGRMFDRHAQACQVEERCQHTQRVDWNH